MEHKPPIRTGIWVGGGLLCVATGALLFVVTGAWFYSALSAAAPVIAYFGLGTHLNKFRQLQAGEEEILRARFLSKKANLLQSTDAVKQLKD